MMIMNMETEIDDEDEVRLILVAYFTDSVYERMMTQDQDTGRRMKFCLKKKNVSNGIDNKLKYRKLIILPKEGK